MRILYIAEDGKQFDDELSCRLYEEDMTVLVGETKKLLSEIKLFDKNGRRIDNESKTNFLSEDLYMDTDSISVPSDKHAEALRRVGEVTGYDCYRDIISGGYWEFHKDSCTFIKRN